LFLFRFIKDLQGALMKKILALHLGANSIGWALMNETKKRDL